jgi:hypothetical protein
MLNASSESQAKRAIGRLLDGWNKKDARHPAPDRRRRRRCRRRLFQTVLTICQMDVAGIVDAIRAIHRPIADRFFTGIGMSLQAQVDGPLMVTILSKMMTLNMPALSVHDSLLCRWRDAEVARAIMCDAYRFRFGFAPVIKRK